MSPHRLMLVEDQLSPSGGYVTCHTPIPGPTRLADLNRFSGRETKSWDSLPDFFLNRTGTCGYGPHLITESKYQIYIQIKRTTTEVVSIKIYTRITKSHLLIQN